MYLAIRKFARSTGPGIPDNRPGDVVAVFPDNYLDRGDFGAESCAKFDWVRVPGLTEEDAESLLLDDVTVRRRFAFEPGVGRSLGHAREMPPSLAAGQLDSRLFDRVTGARSSRGVRRAWARTRKAEKIAEFDAALPPIPPPPPPEPEPPPPEETPIPADFYENQPHPERAGGS